MSSQLLGLAPELRNMLYELAFTTDSQGPIDLCTLASPLTALLYTCHQIYSEALQLYHEVRNSYWSQIHFIIGKNIQDAHFNDKRFIKKHPAQALQRIRHLKITAHSQRQFSNRIATSTHLSHRGLWKSTSSNTVPGGCRSSSERWVTRGTKKTWRNLSCKSFSEESEASEFVTSFNFRRASVRYQILDIL